VNLSWIKIGVLQKELQKTFYDISRFEFINEELAIWKHSMVKTVALLPVKIQAERDRKPDDILTKIQEKIKHKTARTKSL